MLSRRTLSLSFAALSGTALAVLRLFLFVFRYDTALAHYSGRWEEPTVLILLVAIILIFAFLSRRQGDFAQKSSTAPLSRIGILPGFFYLAFGVSLLTSLGKTVELARVLLLIAALASLAAAASLIFLGLPANESLAILLFPTLAPILYAVYRYFDITVPMNSPAKLYEMIAAMAVAVAFLMKCRNVATKPMPRFSYAATAVAAVLCFGEGLPRTVTAITSGDAVSVLAALLFLSLTVYFALALYSGIGNDITDTEANA